MESEVIKTLSLKKGGSLKLKRLFDMAFSLGVLILLAPLYLVIALLIKFFSPGNAIFAQDRLGVRGKVFKCYKFRTMHIDAEKHLKALLNANPLLKKEWEEKQKLKNDPRIFPFGKFLRKTSLDELPQFWNVLKGDLSVVGPRPYIIDQKAELGSYAYKILSIRPGITGIWQTSGRSRTTFQQRIELDASYVDKKSFWFDLYLIIKTIPSMIFTKNAC